ncbi:MAG TPA: glycosyltransferase, partial [Myxococcales bacterium]|nr:glycosyltransferase [Myxococcales bacterium]
MRVLLVGDYPPPHGGISVHVASLAEVLRRRGCEVRVLDVGRPPKATAPAGVAIARTRPQVASEIFRAARQGHLVHVHVSGHNAPSWSLAAVSTWLSRPFGPSLVTVHSGLAPAYLARGPSRWAARLACAPASRVICANEDIQRSLRRCDLRPGRLETLPAFIDERSPLPPVPALFAALRSRSRRVLAIALGEGPEYGRQLFLETLARL